MNVIVENSANLAMNYIFYYNLGYSLKNAVETDDDIRFYINKLASKSLFKLDYSDFFYEKDDLQFDYK